MHDDDLAYYLEFVNTRSENTSFMSCVLRQVIKLEIVRRNFS